MNGHYLNCWPVKKIVMSDMLSFDSSRIKVIFFYWKIETFLRWLAKPDHWKGNTIWTVCTSVGIVTITPDSCGLRGIRLPELIQTKPAAVSSEDASSESYLIMPFINFPTKDLRSKRRSFACIFHVVESLSIHSFPIPFSTTNTRQSCQNRGRR
jgi:hypothetical protein